jgi:hypothetical protein
VAGLDPSTCTFPLPTGAPAADAGSPGVKADGGAHAMAAGDAGATFADAGATVADDGGAAPIALADAGVRGQSASTPLTGASLNLALVTQATGACVAPGQCFVPLEEDPSNNDGWSISGNTVKLIPGICAKVQAGAQLYMVEGSCPSKVVSDPVCEPTTAIADGGAAVDSGVMPAADASVSSCDGDYVVTCAPSSACNAQGGSAGLTVAGTQGTLSIPQHGGSSSGITSVQGTVDPVTCTATFVVPADDAGACDQGGTLVANLAAGTTGGVPCSTNSNGICTQGMLTCTVARGTFDGGGPALDGGITLADSGVGGGGDAGFNGGDSGTLGGGSGTLNGSVDGITFTPVDEVAATGPINGASGPEYALGVILSDVAGACSVAQNAQAGGCQRASSTQLALAVVTNGSTPIGPGTYPVTTNFSPSNVGPGQTLATGNFTQADSACAFQPSAVVSGFPDYQATSGSVTITQIDSSTVSGTYSLNFNYGSVGGDFVAPVCVLGNLQQLFTTNGSTVGAGPDVNGICYEGAVNTSTDGGGVSYDGGFPDASPPADASTDAGFDGSADGGADAGVAGDAGGPADAGTASDGASGGDAGLAPDGGAAAACDLVPGGALSWWRAEGDSTDTYGSNPATWNGVAAYSGGVAGNGFAFAGSSYLYSTVTGVSAAAGGSVEGWVYLDQLPQTSYQLFGFGSTGQTMDGPAMVAAAQGPMWVANFQFGGQTLNGPMLNPMAWTHIAVTWSPITDAGTETISVYVNGALFNYSPVSFADAGNFTAFLMGGDASGVEDLVGVLDEVTLYSGQLSASQIQAIYSAGAAGKCECHTSTDCVVQPATCNAGICAGVP